ncbi:vezatin-like [Hetaerina americana]|uniref:vezatin-like n=1 Tax=Hetaerina americana TaxID=62018 RepID=UPI003A7F18ED
MEEDSVIIEGTPLAAYLKDLGLEEEIEDGYVEEEEPEVPQPLTSKVSRFRNLLSSLFKTWRSPGVVKKIKLACIQKIVEAGIIEEEDISQILEERGLQGELRHVNISWSVMKKIIGESLLAVIPAIAVGVIGQSSFKASMVAVIPTAALLVRWISVFPALGEFTKLARYLDARRLFQQDLRRATRIVNEQALIAKGYNINMQACASAWRLEREDLTELSNLAQRSLPGVRVAIFQTTSRLALALSRELQLQRQHHPLPFNLDHPSLRYPDIDESGAEKAEVPSLATLRVAIKKFFFKEGELVKRLLVDLLSSEDDTLRISLRDELLEILIDCIQELKVSLVFHKTLYCQTVQCNIRPDGEKIADNTFYSYCQSARGHLEEAMRTVRVMEQYLEHNDPFTVAEPWMYLHHKIKFHAEVFNVSLEKAYILLIQRSSRNEKCSVTLPASEEHSSFLDVRDEVQLCRDPIDEVFEVIGEGTNEMSANDVDEGSALRKNDESSRLVLEELKSVIKFKALEWEEREKKVREKTRSATCTREEDLWKVLSVKNTVEFPSSSSSTNDGEQTPSSIPSWVLPSSREPLNDLPPAEGASAIGQMIGSMASEAVAIAKLNQAAALLDLTEDMFISDED